MSLLSFSQKVKKYLKLAGYSQKILANTLGFDQSVLSHKLNGTGRTALTFPEIRAIVKSLVQLEAITFQSEAVDLLSETGCPNFSNEEWKSIPLNKLDLVTATNTLERNKNIEYVAERIESNNYFDQIKTNLPVEITSFVGREHEIAEVRRLLSNTHLLTLTGPGGVGKTRLTLKVAGELKENYKDGVWLVELAPISNPKLVLQTICLVLNVREEPDKPLLTTLKRHLYSRQLLLVLDNCEHLIDECAQLIAELLSYCPNLQVLATSREGLRIDGETLLRVPSLSFPNSLEETWHSSNRPGIIPVLLNYEAVKLFMERAIKVQPHFAITDRNAHTVIQICRRVDGIPLAIELAAVWMRSLTLEQIEERLNERFSFLIEGSRAKLPRHQTMQALIDWSYELLTANEQILFCRLSVFRGGWTLEAAEAVCSGEFSCGMIKQISVFELLMQLVSKSLVMTEERGDTLRYSMLETLREYGLSKLENGEEFQLLKYKQSLYFLNFVETTASNLLDINSKDGNEQLDRENDNLRAAMQWSLWANQAKMVPKSFQDPQASGLISSAEIALRISSGIWRFWSVRGLLNEGRDWLKASLSILDIEKSPSLVAAQSEALLGASSLALTQGDYKQANILLEERLKLSYDLGNQLEIAEALDYQGRLAFLQKDYVLAESKHSQSLFLYQKIGEQEGIARVLTNLGDLARLQGDYSVAGEKYDESFKIFTEIKESFGLARSLFGRGRIALLTGEHNKAKMLLKESLQLSYELRDRIDIRYSLEQLATIAGIQGQPILSAILLGSAENLREEARAPIHPAFRADYEEIIAMIRQQLDGITFTENWSMGKTLTIEQILSYALQL